jgi:hypothetical protein
MCVCVCVCVNCAIITVQLLVHIWLLSTLSYFILFYFIFVKNFPLIYLLNFSCVAVNIVFVDLQKKAITNHNFDMADISLLYIIH